MLMTEIRIISDLLCHIVFADLPNGKLSVQRNKQLASPSMTMANFGIKINFLLNYSVMMHVLFTVLRGVFFIQISPQDVNGGLLLMLC